MSSRMNGYRSDRGTDRDRPPSEQLVDLHVYIVPPDIWREKFNNALNQNINDTVSVGLIRVHPETKVFVLRDEIEQQLGTEVIPREYVFLKSVGRSLTRLKSKQEYQMKAKHFLPPNAYAPEIYLLEATPEVRAALAASSEGSTRPQTQTSLEYDTYRPNYGPAKRNHGNNVPPITSPRRDDYLPPLSATPPPPPPPIASRAKHSRHESPAKVFDRPPSIVHNHIIDDSGLAGYSPVNTYRENNDVLDRRKRSPETEVIQEHFVEKPEPEREEKRKLEPEPQLIHQRRKNSRNEEEEERQRREAEERRRREEEEQQRRDREEHDHLDWERQKREEEDRRRREEEARRRRDEEERRRKEEEKEKYAEMNRMKSGSDDDLAKFPSPPPPPIGSPKTRLTSAERRRKKGEKEKLLRELEAAREARHAAERQREELVRKAKQMQSKTQSRRNHAKLDSRGKAEDASLSVVGKADKNLKLSGDFKAEEKVEMNWGKPGKGKKQLYHGTIIIVSDDEEFLTKWVTEANKKILQKLETKPDSVPKELFSFTLDNKSSPTKRHRILTTKIKESMIQDEEMSPKKKKQKVPLGKRAETMPPIPKEPKIMQGSVEKGTVSEQTLKIDTPSSKLKERKQREEATSCEISKQIFNSCMADQFNNPSVQHMNISDQFTPFTETWALCNNLTDEQVNPEIQHVVPLFEENRERNLIPVPSAEVVNILEQLCRPDVQEFLKKLTEHFRVGACSHQANECFENIQPTYTQLDTVLERHICTTPLPSSSHFGGINQVKATFKAAPERSPRKEVSSGQEDVQSNMQVKLLEAYDLTVHKDGLRKAISAAKKSQKPGYTLCYKLLPEAFSLEMLANSRGQGMTSVKEGDLRPCLDKTKVCAIKDYVLVWCKKNGHPSPLESSLNDAIT